MRSQTNNAGEDTPTVRIGKREIVTKRNVDLRKKDDCRMMNTFLSKNYPVLFSNQYDTSRLNVSGRTANKTIILLPPVLNCCGKRIKMDNRPSFPFVYTLNGTYVGAQFHGQFCCCKTIFYPSYKTIDKKRVYFNPSDKNMQYFQVTSQTVFNKQLLEDISNNIWVSGCTFQSRAKRKSCKRHLVHVLATELMSGN